MSKGKVGNIFTPYSESFESAYFNNFYESVKDVNFNSIDADNKDYLDSIVDRFKSVLIFKASRGMSNKFANTVPLLNATVRKICSKYNNIGLETADQMVYFLINIVDSDLEYLKRHKASLENYGDTTGVINFYGFSEPKFALLEEKYNDVFHVVEELVNDNEEKTRI